MGNKVKLTYYVDADYARDKVTRESVSSYMIFINNTLYKFYTKRQNTVQTSTFGSELVATSIAVEAMMEIHYVLRTIGVRIEKTSILYGDNKSVVLNTTVPSSMLKKKHQGCAYHRVCEAVAAGITSYIHIGSKAHYSYILTKPLCALDHHHLI